MPRFFRNWQRKKNRILPSDLAMPFYHAEDANSVQDYFLNCKAKASTKQTPAGQLGGRCFVCDEDVTFDINAAAGETQINWRETLVCQQCLLINRWRGCMHIFETICEPFTDDRIYLTETLSPVYQQLSSRYPQLTASEFLPQFGPGSMVRTHAMDIRHEDVTQLTFPDRSFEIVLCFDVLEHIPTYRQALSEFYRVLASGGQLILSVPFSFEDETRVRAKVDALGNVTHFVEPCYHGDPLSETGILSYYDFGMDLLKELQTAGFRESFLVCYHSRKWGYLGENIAYVARKV